MIVSKGRIEWIDYAKAIGIFCIVLGHTMKGSLIWQFVFTFQVPLFFFLAGVTFNSKLDYKAFLLKKTKTILIPYWTVMAISIIVFYFMGSFAAERLGEEIESFSWIKYLCGSLYGNSKSGYMRANLPLWFLPCVCVVENLLYGINKLMYKIVVKYWIKLSSLMLVSLSISFVNYYFTRIEGLPFAMETAVSVLPYAILGYGFKKFNIPRFSKMKIAIYPTVLMMICLVMGCFINTATDCRSDIYGNLFIYVIAAVCGIFGICLLCRNIPSNRYLSYIGQNTMIVLLLHKFPVLFFQVLFKPTVNLVSRNQPIACIIVALLSMLMCLIAGEVLDRVCPWIVGKNRFKKEIK